MTPINLDSLIHQIRTTVSEHRLAAGSYARYANDTQPNEYGCADAANILYSIGDFPRDPAERAGFVDVLRKMQNKQTGMFSEATHHTIHTTAHCIAALELFDAAPLYPCKGLAHYASVEGISQLLEQDLPWIDPWSESHRGAGFFVSLTQTGAVDLAWKDAYFRWLWDHTDERTGFICFGDSEQYPIHRLMASNFHYLFNIESEHRPMRYPDRVIDSCLQMMVESTAEHSRLIRGCGFIDVDLVYCLNRAMRQSPHRFHEAKKMLENFAERYVDMLNAIDYQSDKNYNDLHMLFGTVCCLAELQSALPGKLITSKPLRLVLDRRPFI